MPKTPTTIKELPLDDPASAELVNMILGGSHRDAAGVVAQRLADFHADCRCRTLTAGLLFATYEGPRAAGGCLALVSPGAAALMLIPPGTHESEKCRRATGRALAAARSASSSRPITLLQFLQDPQESALSDTLQDAGFRRLTTLVYLQRSLQLPRSPVAPAEPTDWVAFSPATEPLFVETLARTYEGSLDCPELSGLRHPRDILASHRAAGEFDPNSWWLALRGKEPVGVLLLARLSNRGIVEVVYVGVVQSARGEGVADILLDRALAAARNMGAQTLALAVDERNRPARRLYARWGFAEIGRRVAWIATNPRVEACAPGMRAGEASESP